MTQTRSFLLCTFLAACGGAAPAPATPAPPPASEQAQKPPPDEHAELASLRAQHAAALRERDEAVARLGQLEKAYAELVEQLDAAVAAIEAAQHDADRAAAKAKLEALERENARLDARKRTKR